MYWLLNPTSLTIVVLFITNLLICRWLTSRMIIEGYIVHGTVIFERSVYFWFVPILGLLGLVMLYLVLLFKSFFKWFFFNHYTKQPLPVNEVKLVKKRAPRKPKPVVDLNKLTDEEILKRASKIAVNNAKKMIEENLAKSEKRKTQKRKAKGFKF